MTESAAWVRLSTVTTGLEADLLRQTLEAEDIPVLVQGDQPGIFGAAFQGAVTGGIALLVPDVELERARALLDEGMDLTP